MKKAGFLFINLTNYKFMSNKIRDLREKFFQVDDEYLNGYAKLCGIHATGVYLSMCRHANKQQTCFPSKKLIAEELSISERSVYTAIKKLEEWSIIKIEQQGRKQNGSFKNLLYTLLNKSQWKKKPSANCAVGIKQHYPSANDDTTRRQPVPNKDTHIKETHIKNLQTASAEHKKTPENKNLPENKQAIIQENKQIAEIIDIFRKTNPAIEFGNKTVRKASIQLIHHCGFQEAVKWAKFAVEVQDTTVQDNKYAPQITTPYFLWKKLTNLKSHFNKLNKKTYDKPTNKERSKYAQLSKKSYN